VDEIKQDIQKARDIADDIKTLSRKQGFSGNINGRVVNYIPLDIKNFKIH